MKIKLFLHIGYPKTGTTSLQSFLYNFRDDIFKKFSIYYPKTGIVSENDPGHHLLTGTHPYCTKIDITKMWTDLFQEAQIVGAYRILISSEFFSIIKDLEKFKSNFNDNFSVNTIIVYIRRQDLHAESNYSQIIKHGYPLGKFFLTFRQYIQDKLNYLTSYLNYLNQLHIWQKAFPESFLIPRIYDKRILLNGDVISDFLSLIGIQEYIDILNTFKNKNPSLSVLSTLVMRKINEFYSLPPRIYFEVINYLLTLDREEGSGPLKTFFTLEERIEFLERFRESNERLFREWFNSENKFVLTPEEIEFYKEQDKIPKDEIERLVEERYQKVVENVIKKFEAKQKVYIPVELSKLVKEGEVVEKVVIDQLYLDLLKGSKLVVGGVVVLKPEVKEEYRLLVEDAEGMKEVQWRLPSPGYAKSYPDNPYAKNARFKVEGVVATEGKPLKLYLEGKNGDKILIYKIDISLKKEERK